MASVKQVIKKDGSISYKVSYCIGHKPDGTAILKSKTFNPDPAKSKRQNDAALQKFIVELEKKAHSGSLDAERTTFQEYADLWMKTYAETELEKTTYTRYRNGLIHSLYPRIGHVKLSDIKPTIITNCLNDMRKKGYKRGDVWIPYAEETIRTCKIILSSVLTAAVEDGLLTHNPCYVRQRKHKKVEMKEVRSWSQKETDRFLEVIEKPIPIMVPEHIAKRHGKETTIPAFQQGTLEVALKYRALFTLAIFSGMRRGELLGLTWKDVDFHNNTIDIHQTVQYVSGDTFIKSPKSSAGYRTISISTRAMNVLAELKTEQKKTILSMGTAWKGSRTISENYLFTQADGKPMSVSTPRAELKRILTTYNKSCVNEADRLPILTLHELRHTNISVLLALGMEPTAIAERVGQEVLLTRYAHSSVDRNKAAADALENAFTRKNAIG